MRKYYLVFGFFFLSSASLFGQNYMEISQYMYHQSFYNPAVMSTYSGFNAAFLLRQQWVGLEGAPRLYALQASLPFNKMSLGVNLNQTEIGVLKETRALASYSYRVKVNPKAYMAFGVSGGFAVQNREYQKVETSETNDDVFAGNIKSNYAPNFQFGMYYFTSSYYVGLSVPGILRNKFEVKNGKNKLTSSFDKKYVRFYVNGGYQKSLSETWTVNLSSMVKYEENSPLEFDLSTMFTYQNMVGAGISYRTEKDFIALFNVRINQNFKLAYAYQYTKVAYQSLNTHEVMLIYAFHSKDKFRSRRRISVQSPRF